MKKRDFIALVVVALVVALSFLIVGLNNKKGKTANVYLEGKIVKQIDLSVDGEYEIKEGFVVVVVDNKISVKETDCDDKTCLHMGETNSSGKPIVCAPNGIYIKIEGDSEDVIVG